MQAVETEVKIRLAEGENLEPKLERLGFRRVTERTFECNTLYDTAERFLRGRRQILRLRKYGEKWVVTHKSVAEDDDPAQPYKRRMETETKVEDGPALGTIFTQLGYKPVFVYEKWRTEWADEEGHCVLDETPLGFFAELEGPGEWIARMAGNLNVNPSRFIRLSYGIIFEKWRDQTGSKVQNMTFAEIPESCRQGV